MIRANEHQPQHRRNCAYDGGRNGFFAAELLNKDHHKQRCQGKVDAGGIEGDQLPDQTAKSGKHDPVYPDQHAGKNMHPFLLHPVLVLAGTQKAVAFVRQGENEKILPKSVLFEFLNKGDAVKNMAAVQ